ncbi:MAG: GTP cyclohydrolase FolE2 [Desulfobacterota bacterium]|nr:GTP cyclohydrolase FolE2 [Thermodesulfobacteriota bacterium]
MTLKDIHSQHDHRNIDIDKVGVKSIRYPIVVLDKKNEVQHTVATINMYVSLPHRFKGTHMSRFIEILNRYRHGISTKNIADILVQMKHRLASQSAHIEITFPFFIEKEAPVTKAKSLMEYSCTIIGSHREKLDLVVGIAVPVTTLCPCSREISNYGAHNQRSVVRVSVRFKKFFWIEDLISLVEHAAVNEIYPLLKRPDEKFVTERAYENPMFAEDIVRAVAERLDQDPNFIWYAVESENHESIHNHSAYAMVTKNVCVPEGNAKSDHTGVMAEGV